MHAKQLRTRILIQRPVSAQDTSGEPIITWADVGPDWADFRVLQGLEALRADATVNTSRASCRVRYREDVMPNMRVLVAGEAWGIVSQQPDVNCRRFVDLILERTQ